MTAAQPAAQPAARTGGGGPVRSRSGPLRRTVSIGWRALERPGIVLAILALYCAVHLVLRLVQSPVFSLDEAEQLLYGQSLRMGYRFRHPPLITWMVWGVTELFGLSRPAFFGLKYALLFAGFAWFFLAARRLLGEVRPAAVATLVWFGTYQLGYYPHIDLMHTVLLTALLSAFLHALALVHARGSWGDHAYLGLIVGLGLLSKYVFAILPAAALFAAISLRPVRRSLQPARLAAAAALAASVVAPYGLWSLINDHSLVGLTQTVVIARTDVVGPGAWVAGAGELLAAMVEFTLPMGPLIVLVAGLALVRVRVPAGAEERLLGRTILAGGLLMACSVFVVGDADFKARWMHQVLLPLPIWVVARLMRSRLPVGPPFARIAAVSCALALVAVAARVVVWDLMPEWCGRCRTHVPFDRFAGEIRRLGFTGGTILVDQMHVGGNLRVFLAPDRVLFTDSAAGTFPPAAKPDGRCLVVWGGGQGDGTMPDRLAAYLRTELAADPDAPSVTRRLEAPLLRLPKRAPAALHVRLFEPTPRLGACR